MKLEEKDITVIREKWATMLTKEDLLDLLNYAKPLIYGEKAVPFELKQLTWHANSKVNTKRYAEFSVNKKSGGIRTIHAPVKGLKAIQKTLSLILQCVFEPHKAAMGFVMGKSIVDNARLHEGQQYVYNIDLKDFFPSVDQARVWKCLQLPPFNLHGKSESSDIKSLVRPGYFTHITSNGETIHYLITRDRKLKVLEKENYDKLKERIKPIAAEHNIEAKRFIQLALVELIKVKAAEKIDTLTRLPLASLITSLCCCEMEVERLNEKGEWTKLRRNVLPQGAPTSPIITNIVCQKLDFLLSAVGKRFGLKYSRYADDITFSSMHNVYQQDSEFIKELHRIVAQQGFHIKDSKTRLQKEGYRQEVTGLLVNEKVNVQKRYIKDLRKWLYLWEEYGYERAYELFLKDYTNDKGHVNNNMPNMVRVISGKLNYLEMVKGKQNAVFVGLKKRFALLTATAELYKDREEYLDVVLDTVFDNGLDRAMQIYKPNSK